MVYISPFNNNFIFYGISTTFLNSWEDFISISFSINPEQIIIFDISKNKDNSLTK